MGSGSSGVRTARVVRNGAGLNGSANSIVPSLAAPRQCKATRCVEHVKTVLDAPSRHDVSIGKEIVVPEGELGRWRRDVHETSEGLGLCSASAAGGRDGGGGGGGRMLTLGLGRSAVGVVAEWERYSWNDRKRKREK